MAILAPFFVAGALFVSLLASRFTGFNPSSNAYFGMATLCILGGLFVGVKALIVRASLPLYLRIIVGLLYAPAVLLSALLAGY